MLAKYTHLQRVEADDSLDSKATTHPWRLDAIVRVERANAHDPGRCPLSMELPDVDKAGVLAAD